MLKKLWSFLRGCLVVIGFLVVASVCVAAWGLKGQHPPLPSKMVLGYTFYGTPPDAPDPAAWYADVFGGEPTLSEVTGAIYKAARDPRIQAFAVKLEDGDYAWADVQELRAAITAFRATGKRTYVYAESYGDLYPGMAVYYLATAFDEIWVQPVGAVAITGFHAEMPYFKKTLEMVGVAPEILQKGDYKTAPESALLDNMSNAQRETLHGILASMMTDFFDGVAAGRKLPAAQVGQLIDGAPYTADEALTRKLVDVVGYEDQLMAKLFPEDGASEAIAPQLVDAMEYLYSQDSGLEKLLKKDIKHIENNKKNNGVAVVYVTGMIVSGYGGGGGIMGDRAAYASDIADAIMSASDDPDVAAIVMRVASPGGSPAASETIRRAVEVAKGKGKYVVVSMGAEAASGGYWICVDADKLFAQTGTLTGSIGVFGGKASFAGLWDKLGVNWDGVELGANASMWSSNRPYSEDQRASVQRMLDDIYDGFVARVAKGRSFAPEVVEGMAQGRVWTGRQAKERGLIDGIGGMRTALEDVAQKLGVDDVAGLDIITYDEPSDPIEEIKGLLMGGVRIVDVLRPFLREAALVRHPEQGITLAPTFAIRP